MCHTLFVVAQISLFENEWVHFIPSYLLVLTHIENGLATTDWKKYQYKIATDPFWMNS